MSNLASRISDAELEVMRVLWAGERPLGYGQILTPLLNATDWDRSTIKTMLRRLCGKGVVEILKDERGSFFYSPVISEREYLHYSTENFIKRIHRGSVKNLFATLLSGHTLDDKDIADLRRMFKVDGDE